MNVLGSGDEPQRLTGEADEHYRMLVDAVTDYAIYMLDLHGRVASWNPGAQRFKGYTAAEILGQHFSRFYTEEDLRIGLPATALATAAGEGRFENEGWRVRKDGTRFWAHVIIDPIYNSARQLVGYAKVTRDLTERRATEEALRHSEQNFRLLIQGVTDYAIYMLDPTGRITNWNAGATRIKGYTAQEIVGDHFSKFYTPEDRAAGEPQRGLDTAIRDGRFEKEGWRIRKDGTRFWANVIIDPIRDDDGTLIGFAKVTRDITDKKNTEEELQATREALFQAQKMEAIGQLSGGIAHDFNNLLMAILSSLELAQKRLPDDPKLRRFIDNAVHGAKRGASLTQRMLAFARRQTLTREATSVSRLVTGLKDLIRRSLGPSIEVSFDIPSNLNDIMVDVNQLESAILNIVVNARDAMVDGGALFVSARSADMAGSNDHGLAEGSYVCLTVSDTGTGMDEETLTKAGEPFFTTKGVGKGTGLGLSQVHGLLLQLGGRFILKSTLGVGTVAEFWLPIATTPAEASALAVEEEAPAAAPARKLRVLAVDDDALVLMNTTAMLEDMGHLVRDAASAREALDILRQEPPFDLIITDMAMPAMNGADFARLVRADWPNLPILLATGYAELPDDGQPKLPMLGKPFGERELAKGIGLALGYSA